MVYAQIGLLVDISSLGSHFAEYLLIIDFTTSAINLSALTSLSLTS